MQHTQSQVFLRSNLKTVKRAEPAHLGSNPSPGRGQGYDIGLAGLKFVGSCIPVAMRETKRVGFSWRESRCVRSLFLSHNSFKGPLLWSGNRNPDGWRWELRYFGNCIVSQSKRIIFLALPNIHWGSASDLFRETCGWNLGWPTPIFRIGHIRGFCGRKQNFRRAVFGGRNLNLNPHSQK